MAYMSDADRRAALASVLYFNVTSAAHYAGETLTEAEIDARIAQGLADHEGGEAERILAETEAKADTSWSDMARACDHATKVIPAFVARHIPWRKVRSLPVRADVRAEALADLAADLSAILPVLDEYAQAATDEECFGRAWRPAIERFDRNRATLDAMDEARQ